VVTPISAQVIFSETFEVGWGPWSADNGVWGVGVPTAGPSSCFDGTQCAGTVLEGNYPEFTDSRLISPSIQLPNLAANGEIHLRFSHWFSYALNDQGMVQISVFEGTTGIWSAWKNISSAISQISEVWSIVDLDLTQYANMKVRIAFFHTTSCSPGNCTIAVSTG
jgi:hypothetical protein